MKNFKREIFASLGSLFYALAAGQQISIMASGKLKMLLRKDWLTETGAPSDDKVSEAAHLISLTIDTLENEKTSAADAYERFKGFYENHREQFANALKVKIIETAEAILQSFPSKDLTNEHFSDLKNTFSSSTASNQIL